MDEHFLDKKLGEREESHSLRSLTITGESMIDFCSNDYLGIVKNKLIETSMPAGLSHGSTGSRLLSGNYQLIEELEKKLADFLAGPEKLYLQFLPAQSFFLPTFSEWSAVPDRP